MLMISEMNEVFDHHFITKYENTPEEKEGIVVSV